MQQQKIMKRVSAAVSMLVLSSSLMVGPSAHAVTPDNGQILGGIWTTASLIKEYFDWRSWAGWGAVGVTNIVITVGTGGSNGQFTRAVFTNLCGSTAAGFVAAWRPSTEPGAATHIKAIAKAGATTAAASACGWATQAILSRIDAEIPRAQNAIDNAQRTNKPNYDEIVDDKTKVNNALLGIEQKYKEVAQSLTAAAARATEYRNANCSSPTQNNNCASLDQRRRNSQSLADSALVSFNAYGTELSKQIKELAFDVKS
ncbi:MAG: hypothetical protein ACKVOT_06400 [Polaromonas sp.]